MILFPGTRACPNYLPIVTVLPQLIGYWTRYHRVAVKYGTAFVSPSCLMNTIGSCVCIIRDKYRFSFSSILDTIHTAILLQNTGQQPFSFLSLVTMYSHIAAKYGTATLFPFRLSGHYTIQPYCCKIRDSYPFSISSLDTLRPRCCEIRDSYSFSFSSIGISISFYNSVF